MTGQSDDITNLPFEEAARQGEEYASKGALIFFKFTCAGCGARQTFDVPNTLYAEASCEECDHITDLRVSGVGYMLVI